VRTTLKPVSRSEPFAKNSQIAGNPLSNLNQANMATLFVAQVMTRGMVKSRLKYESMMGNPQPSTSK
jgi:hypothetical protein